MVSTITFSADFGLWFDRSGGALLTGQTTAGGACVRIPSARIGGGCLPGRVGGGGFGLTDGGNGGGALLTTAGGTCTRYTTTIIGGGCLLGRLGGGGFGLTHGRNGGGAFLGSAFGLNVSVDDCEPLIANK